MRTNVKMLALLAVLALPTIGCAATTDGVAAACPIVTSDNAMTPGGDYRGPMSLPSDNCFGTTMSTRGQVHDYIITSDNAMRPGGDFVSPRTVPGGVTRERGTTLGRKTPVGEIRTSDNAMTPGGDYRGPKVLPSDR